MLAPDIFDKSGYDHKIDVWALGVIFYQMLTNMYVFNAKTMEELFSKWEKGVWKWPNDVKISVQGFDFLNRTLTYDKNKRISWDDISHHTYFQSELRDLIPLKVSFESSDQKDGLSYGKKGEIVLNTKKPAAF